MSPASAESTSRVVSTPSSAPFSTLYGAAQLAWFNVWNYQVDPAEVNLGDPVDLTKRLDGTPELRFPAIGFLVSSQGTIPESELRLVSIEMTHMIS
jgi:hypothetical protein